MASVDIQADFSTIPDIFRRIVEITGIRAVRLEMTADLTVRTDKIGGILFQTEIVIQLLGRMSVIIVQRKFRIIRIKFWRIVKSGGVV